MLAVPQLWIVPLPLLAWILVALVMRVRDLYRLNRRNALEGRLRSAMRAAPPEPRINPLEELLSQGGPDLCAGCGRPRTVLLEYFFDFGTSFDHDVSRACVWCDAGTADELIGVWDDGVWLLLRSASTNAQRERVLQLVVAEHLAAIAAERPHVALPDAGAVADLWSRRGDEHPSSTEHPLRLVRVLNPWLDRGSAQRFLLHLGGADPRTVAPAVIPPTRDLLPLARLALDELTLLRADLAAASDATESAYRPGSDLEAVGRREVIETFLRELDGSSAPARLCLAESDGWSEQYWWSLLTRVRRARAELAALAYPPALRRQLFEWLDRDDATTVVEDNWIRRKSPCTVTPTDVRAQAELLATLSGKSPGRTPTADRSPG